MSGVRLMTIHNTLWIVYFLLFLVSPLDYPFEIWTFFGVLGLLLLGNISYVFGRYFGSRKYLIPTEASPRFDEQRFYRFILLTSFLYFFLTAVKYAQLHVAYGFGFSFHGLNQLRIALENPDYVMGGSLVGVIASVFAGFPLLSLPFFALFQEKCSARQKITLLGTGGAYLLTTFLTGGRNGAMITMLIMVFSVFVVVKIFGKKRIQFSGPSKLLFFAVFLFLFKSFSAIFISRAEILMGNLPDYIDYFIDTHFYSMRPYAYNLLHNEQTVRTYFPIMFFHEYFVHSLNELDLLFKSSPANFPYWGGYEFYTFTLFFNKLGAAFTPINEILTELPRPGRYYTLFGGLYLDFGVTGMIVAVSILYFGVGRAFRNFLRTRSLISLMWFIYFYLIIFLSPIYSLIGTAIFPGFLVALIVCTTFHRFGYFKSKPYKRPNKLKVA